MAGEARRGAAWQGSARQGPAGQAWPAVNNGGWLGIHSPASRRRDAKTAGAA